MHLKAFHVSLLNIVTSDRMLICIDVLLTVMRQITDHIIMIRPKHFGFNAETAANNVFQSYDNTLSAKEVATKAMKEFDAFVLLLEKNGIHVDVIEDTDKPAKPDAVFPNNWFSTHADGVLITYPMKSDIRRAERREDIVEDLAKRYGVTRRYAFEVFEDQEKFLEGTGSLVLDHVHKIAYACLSPRTDVEVLDKFCILRDYTPCTFHAVYNGAPVYHTNVVMSLGTAYVVICMECIPDEKERELLKQSFEMTKKEVIAISSEQMAAFAGNMIQLQSRFGDAICVMSDQAYQALDKSQIRTLEQHNRILHAPMFTIEKYGGGSARCMIAENFLSNVERADSEKVRR